MVDEEIKRFITDTIKKELNSRGFQIDRILFFGSRAAGSAHNDSDWDFLVVTDKKMSWRKKRDFWYDLSLILSRQAISADVLLKSKSEFRRDQKDKGKVTYYAVKNGINA